MLFFVLALLCVQSAYAHTYLSAIFLNNQKLSEGDCVRAHPQSNKEYPLTSVTAADMTCGWLPEAAKPANRKCPIAAGSTVGIQWLHNNVNSVDIIEATHKGPVIFYLAKSESGSGNVWFKIFEDGYTPSNGQWGVDRLIANNGRIDVTIPIDIAPGNYLLRGEVLALHNAYDVGGIQPYVGCVELSISGSGSATPQGVAFPGAYTPTGPGMLLNIYQAYNSYTIPGPALYKAGSVVTPTSTPSATKAPTNAPTNAPPASTKAPTSAPSVAPTTRPTNAPTRSPSPSPSPSQSPSPSPSSHVNSIRVALWTGSSEWWAGIQVNGGGETIVKVEWRDKTQGSWVVLKDMGWAFVYDQNLRQEVPLTIRVTSSSGKQATFNNIITSWDPKQIDTGVVF